MKPPVYWWYSLVLYIPVFPQFSKDEPGCQGGFGFKPFGGQAVDVADFARAFGEIGDLDQPFFQEAFEDVVDLPQADARVIRQLPLGCDGLEA